jgi:hypothetical protein
MDDREQAAPLKVAKRGNSTRTASILHRLLPGVALASLFHESVTHTSPSFHCIVTMMNSLCPSSTMQQQQQQPHQGTTATWQDRPYFQWGTTSSSHCQKRPWHQFSRATTTTSSAAAPPQQPPRHTVTMAVSSSFEEEEEEDENNAVAAMDNDVAMTCGSPLRKRRRTLLYSTRPPDSPFLFANHNTMQHCQNNSSNRNTTTTMMTMMTTISSSQGSDVSMEECSSSETDHWSGEEEEIVDVSLTGPSSHSGKLPAVVEWWKRPRRCRTSVPIATILEEELEDVDEKTRTMYNGDDDDDTAMCHVCQGTFELPATPQVEAVMPANALLHYFAPTHTPFTAHRSSCAAVPVAKKNPAACSCCDRWCCTTCRQSCHTCQQPHCSFCLISEDQSVYCLDCHRDYVTVR